MLGLSQTLAVVGTHMRIDVISLDDDGRPELAEILGVIAVVDSIAGVGFDRIPLLDFLE